MTNPVLAIVQRFPAGVSLVEIAKFIDPPQSGRTIQLWVTDLVQQHMLEQVRLSSTVLYRAVNSRRPGAN
jgi:hypothetical protein